MHSGSTRHPQLVILPRLESPKLRDHIDRIRRSLATVLGIDADRISVKAKTNEGVDAIGRGEAIAAQAIALLRRV